VPSLAKKPTGLIEKETSGSSVVLAFARIFTVTRYKIQLLLPAVRLA
jgi:hypothetical protein